MKILSKFSILIFSFFLLSLFLGNNAYAVVIPKTANLPENTVLIADVNIRDAKIISQEGNKFKISFNLLNGEGVQSGVRYGVVLLRVKSKTLKYLVDEKVYDESVSLNSNTKIQKEIEYIAPSFMNGEYKILLSAKNESGLPFSMISVGDVKLTSTTTGIEIIPETCYVQVVGEASGKTYRLSQGVDIKKEENIKLTCEVQNSSKEVVKATPIYETRFRSNFGEIVDNIGGDITPITLKSLEKKSLSFVLAKATTPQSYNVKFALNNNGVVSNYIGIQYVVRGSSATIQNLSLDKDYYSKGETAKVSFFYSSSADSFPGSRFGASQDQTINSEFKVLDGKSKNCADPFIKILDSKTPPNVDIPITITSSCIDPKIIVTITDQNGVVLDQKEFNIKTTPKASQKDVIPYVIAIIIILIIIAIYLFIKKRKGANTLPPSTPSNPSVPISVLFFLFLLSLTFIPTNSVQASTALNVGYGTGDTVVFALDLDKTNYGINEYITMSATMSMLACGNIPVDVSLDGEINQSSINILTATSFSQWSQAGGDPFIWNSNAVLGPSQTGDFNATFTATTSSTAGDLTKSTIIGFKVVDPPTVEISANPLSVVAGENSVVTWRSNNATYCTCTYADLPCVGLDLNNLEYTVPHSISYTFKTKALNSTNQFKVVCQN